MLLLVGLAHASWSVRASYDRVSFQASYLAIGANAVRVAVAREVGPDVDVELGARWLSHPLIVNRTGWELYGCLWLSPELERWRPRMGVELGGTGGLRTDWDVIYGDQVGEGSAVARAAHVPIWVGVAAAPLRFERGPWTWSVGELSLGGMAAGRFVRVQASPLVLERAW